MGRGLVRYRNQADRPAHELRTAMHHYCTNQEAPLMRPSCCALPLVSCPVLTQIKPQVPRLVVPFRQFL